MSLPILEELSFLLTSIHSAMAGSNAEERKSYCNNELELLAAAVRCGVVEG